MTRILDDYPSISIKVEDLDGKIDFVRFFGRPGPIHIEIGSGKGTFLVNQARAHPGDNFLGIEWASRYYRIAVDRIGRWNITNVRLIRTDAAMFIPEFIPDMFSVAVHYRTGRGYDGPYLQDQTEKEPGVVYVDEKYPMRFLPIDYFFDQLEWVFQRMNHHPLYVRIFTDDPDIPEVEEAFKSRFANYPILFAENTELDYEQSTISE